MTTESLSVTIEGELLTVEIGTVAAPAGGGGGGSGDVVGPASATDDRLAAFDGVTGKLIKQGTVTATAVASHLGSTSNPHSVTAAQVGADPTGTAAAAVSAHAGAVDPHGDRAYADGLAGNYATAGHNHTGVYQPLATVLTNTTAAFTTAQETKLSGIETAADVTDAGNVGTAIDGATAKTTPVDADTVALIDSAASNVLKKLSWANIKATAKTYFDTLYQAASATLTTWAGITPGTGIATALGTNVGTAGAPVINGGALGTPSSGNLANCTGYPSAVTQAGLRLSDTFNRLAVSPWTTVGTNIWTANGTELSCTAAGSYTADFLQYPSETLTNENWTVTCRFKAPAAITGSTNGICVSLKSSAGWFARNLYFLCNCSTTYNGMLYIVDNAGSTLANSNSPTMVVSANDQTRLTIRRIGHIFYATWENETTGQQASATYSFPDSGNGVAARAFVAISSATTATTIQGVTITSNDVAGCDFAVMGDSISAGHNQFASGLGWVDVVRSRVPYKIVNTASSGMMALDADADAVIANVSAHTPTHCIVWLGTNDLVSGRTAAQALVSLQGIESKLNAAGITPHFITCLPRGTTANNTLAASILSTFTNVIDFRKYFLQGASAFAASYSTDAVHPNVAGHRLIAREVEAYMRSLM